MKFQKRVVSIAFSLLILLSVTVSAYAVVSQSESFYVTDNAGVLSAETEQMIINYNGALEQQCDGAQIAVVTVDYLDGMYCDDYAYLLFNNWGIGSEQYNNGMLLLLSTEQNKAWLAYGLGLNDCLDEDTVNDMLDDYFWHDFDKGRYDEAVTKLFAELLKWYDKEYNASTAFSASSSYSYDYGYGNGYPSGYGHYTQYDDDYYQSTAYSGGLGNVIRFLVVVAIFYVIFGGGSRRGGGSWLPWYLLFRSAGRSRPTYYRTYNNYRGNSHSNYGGFYSGGGHSGGFGSYGGGFGGGSGHGGGGFSGGGGGRR